MHGAVILSDTVSDFIVTVAQCDLFSGSGTFCLVFRNYFIDCTKLGIIVYSDTVMDLIT